MERPIHPRLHRLSNSSTEEFLNQSPECGGQTDSAEEARGALPELYEMTPTLLLDYVFQPQTVGNRLCEGSARP